MSADKQDEVINKLYQHRKSAVRVPEITLEDLGSRTTVFKEKRFSLMKYIVVIFGGGLASFGILAVISHLAKAPVPSKPINKPYINTSNTIEFKTDALSQLKNQAVNKAVADINKGLPELKTLPKRVNDTVNFDDVRFPIVATSLLDDNFILTVKQPVSAANVIHRVLPTYPKSVLLSGQSGKVKLAYQVNQQGVVNNIKVINSNGSRALEKSSIKALSNWQFVGNAAYTDEYEVVFEFIKP